MATEDDGYNPEGEDELYEQSAQILDDVTNGRAEDFEGSAVQSILRAQSRLLAQNQEQSLEALYDAAYLATATGEQLDAKVKEIGIQRKPATPATGVAQFARDSEPTSNFLIKSGTPITTVNGDVEFLTTEKGTVGLIDGFESSSLDTAWSGDTGAFDPQQSVVDDGSYALSVDAQSDVSMRKGDVSVVEGDRLNASVSLSASGAVGVQFAAQDGSNYYSAVVDESAETLSLVEVDSGTETTLSSTAISIPTDTWLTVVIDWSITGEVTIELRDGDNTIASVTNDTTLYDGGLVGVESRSGTTTDYVDTLCTTATTLNIEAAVGGEDTNVGGDRLTVMPSRPTGITSVTNPVPTGDTNYTDTDGQRLVTGTNRETDEKLRERASKSAARGGAATVPAVKAALRDIDTVIGVTATENDELSDDGDGRPPLSVEFVIYGGEQADIAETLHRNVGFTERLVSGYAGTSVSYDIYDELFLQTETYTWSRPTLVDLDIILDLVVDETYVGDNDVKQRIVQYVGGRNIDGSTDNGTSIGDDVRVDALRDRIVGPDTGVRGIASITIDATGDDADDTTTDANGLTVYSVADDSVAQTDALDGSISITTTEV